MRLLIQHRSHYDYPTPAALGPQLVRLRPANHTKARIETYSLKVEPDCQVRWLQDPAGNHVANASFAAGSRTRALDIVVEFAVDVRPVNPFDFFIDDRFKEVPFRYPAELGHELSPFLDLADPSVAGGQRWSAFLAELPAGGPTVPFVVALNARVNQRIRYVIREEAGIWTPEETLAHESGSCRDSAVLLVSLLRARGLAARFVSGYLIQLTDEGMLPDVPRGLASDAVDLHAWAEVFLPGAGWIGLDATSGLLCSEGHIPLACTARPVSAAPLEGTSDVVAAHASFEMRAQRLGHEPRPTTPYTDAEWQTLCDSAARIDGELGRLGIVMTIGGEPTFNSREHAAEPEWNAEALGETKWQQGVALAVELQKRLAPGAAILSRSGKHYPGESLPRWALEIFGRKDGEPVWTGTLPEGMPRGGTEKTAEAKALARALADALGVGEYLLEAYEDPWRHLQDEASLPVDVDPLAANLDDPEERRRLARVLDRGLGSVAGYVLPLRRAVSAAAGWESERWTFRRGRLFLLPGDSAIGLRLPLQSLPKASTPPTPDPDDQAVVAPDPRRAGELKQQQKALAAGAPEAIRTALCVEARDGFVHVFLPPLPTAADVFALIAAIDRARQVAGAAVILEGYPPPSSPDLFHFSVTPDPGVLEVNLPPTSSLREHTQLMETVFNAALHTGLHAEKYLLDGRQAGSGGGHHLTLGGPSPLASPFLLRPDLLASAITFFQNHPSLSFLFTGLFVGPTSQAPRIDEARHDSLYELEVALARAFDRTALGPPPPWLTDLLFRHLLVDVAGNTHRAEICIDKLFDPATRHGRQGLIELRAFEMPPHPRMAAAQMILVRGLITAFAGCPYDKPLVRWGQVLHDRFLLPFWLWRDFEDVLDYLAQRGLALPAAAFRPFLDLRCPVTGTLQAGDVTVEVRNALEPWHVLGEEGGAGGTSRYVDSSMERIEVRARGLVPERHEVLVNGHLLPMHPTQHAGEFVAGVRFRAWAPAHSLHAHLGIHHPIRIDVLDTWAQRSLGACAYHVWHPEGQAFLTPPLTRFEAAARRAQRFTVEGPLLWPVRATSAALHPDTPYTLDLRRYPMDWPAPDDDAVGAQS